MSRYDYATSVAVVLVAAVLLWALIHYWPMPPERVTEPTPPARIILVTSTPAAIPVGPVVTKVPTATMTPLPDRLPMTPMAAMTRTPIPPTPDWLPTATPVETRPPVQRG